MKALSIFPNPASTYIYFNGLDEVIETIRVYTVNGGLISTIHDVGVVSSFDISGYTPGMYFIVLSTGVKNYAARFVVAE